MQSFPALGPLFHAFSYHGDLEGWRKDIEAGAEGIGLLLTRIEGDQFIIPMAARSLCQIAR
ncbi:hypothetical protein JQF37_25010 [Pseudomonas sp. MIL9]|uniref:hypothetical protein n=1 Tax=Pseudomonas sp. MIL9 TaxID=2807620 RepID=UPI00194F4129|nr:hypothetical protein [Pseudomonas sp. MIL9]MBM6446866.1 hypothetical protein [Pseudomonas sp. MIL9]